MNVTTRKVINVASVPHRSPFRYPGGKTWLVPHVRKWLASLGHRPAEFVEPFAGGGIVGLSVVFEDLADRLTLVELDDAIGAVWRAILGGKGGQLARRITEFEVTHEAVRAVLDGQPSTVLDKAFATIVRNRMQRGGIMAPGASLMKAGENGKGLRSRWYADTLARRIKDIAKLRHRITFVPGDGIQHLRQQEQNADKVFLIDPPYTVAGRRLYVHSELDHEELFCVTARLRGDFLMTYDNAEPVRAMAKRHGLDTHPVAMKNTHHAVMNELLIGRNLDWARR